MATIPVFEKKDQRIGIIAAVLFLGMIFAILLLITYQIADPPPVPFVQPATTELEQLEMENLKVEVGGGSEGTPSDDPVTKPKPVTEKVLTKTDNPDTKTPTGEASSTNTASSNNTEANTKKADNPFGTGGSSESGTGTSAFGQDAGAAGSGPGGVGDGKGRIRLNDPVVDNIVSDANHRINLRLTIDAQGNIIAIKNIASQTTTNDQRILNQVKAAVKAQVKYNKKPNAGLEIVYLTVNLNAT